MHIPAPDSERVAHGGQPDLRHRPSVAAGELLDPAAGDHDLAVRERDGDSIGGSIIGLSLLIVVLPSGQAQAAQVLLDGGLGNRGDNSAKGRNREIRPEAEGLR